MKDSNERREQAATTLRIISMAIIAGPAIFLAIVFFLRQTGNMSTTSESWHPYMDWIGVALAMSAVAAHALLPRLLAAQPGDRITSFQRLSIIRLAMCEGAALFGTVAFFLSGRPLGAGVTLAMLVFMAVAQFPTRERLDMWVDERA